MSKTQAELARLYASPRVDSQGQVRALVLEVVQPVGWEALSRAWQGVQAEFELPAPAIAVSGVDALQLWFSLAAPVALARAHAFLEALRSRYLGELPIARVRLWPDPATPTRHAASVPALQPATGNWSAFVSPDLAAIFSDTPWLDTEPGDEGQAALLRGLRSIAPAAFDAAVAQLQAPAPSTAGAVLHEPAPPAPAAPEDDPRRFLLRVMNDESIDLALRIEAAKALL
jgi:hypothetical protein